MDPLTDVLELGRVSGAVLAQFVAHEPWGVAVDPQPGATFHAIVAGTCWVHTDHTDPIRLMPGDVILLPTNVAHTLASDPGVEAMSLVEAGRCARERDDGAVELPGTGAATRVFCAAYDYDHEVAQPLLSLLPPVLHLPAGSEWDDGAVAATLHLLRFELGGQHPGSRAAVGRLIDVLLVHVLRAWLRTQRSGQTSWLGALHDPVVAQVLALVHAEPQRPWTVDRLAAEANVSRATLARRFVGLVGEPPLAYLTRWRLDVAAQRLRSTDEPIAEIAAGVGYTSAYAFSKAFTRGRGLPPGRYRAAARAAPVR